LVVKEQVLEFVQLVLQQLALVQLALVQLALVQLALVLELPEQLAQQVQQERRLCQ
jgi:hypothetical protein